MYCLCKCITYICIIKVGQRLRNNIIQLNINDYEYYI
nr:MAG TPA: hypothetical protein [Caudoviricetes sp.]